jgi:hypothetical protein
MGIKMSKYQEINNFFDSYIVWIRELFPYLPDGHVMKDSDADNMINHEYAIFQSEDLNGVIRNLSKKYSIPDYYQSFLSAYCYRNLEVPLFSFSSTHPDDELREINSDINRYIEFKLIPVVSSKSGTGYYCIDLVQDEAIVFYKNDERPSLTERNQKLASSFLKVLIFLKEYLDWGGNISGLDDEDKPEALAELKSIDQMISITWDEWWLPRLIVNE